MENTQEPDFLRMSEEELDLIIGEALFRDSLGSKPISDFEKRAGAINWFQANIQRLSDAVCQDKGVINFLVGPERAERNVLFGAVVDALTGVFGGTVPLGALSAKLLHYGVDRLCDEYCLEEGDESQPAP